MTKRSTMKALISSVTLLAICFTMFVGTTFAWFTDSVTSAGNQIVSGTLDVDMVDETGTSLVGDSLYFRNVNGDTDILWEPGATFRTQGFKVKNFGTLAFKYRMIINGIDGDEELLDVITFSIVKADGTAVDIENFEGVLTTTDPLSEVYYLQGVMDTAAGNDYQEKELDGVSVTIIASQAMAESDSFDDTYDAGATYPTVGTITPPATPTFTVATVTQLQAAMSPTVANGEIVVNLAQDLELAAGETWIPLNLDSYTGVSRVIFNGNGHTIKGLNNPLLSDAIFGNTSVEINDLTLEGSAVDLNDDYAGAFVCYADHAIDVSLNNCHLVDATVSGNKYSGGLVGYIAGDVSITNCSVKDSTITGESVGAVAGMFSVSGGVRNATVSGVTVTGNTVNSVKNGSYRVGELIGTSNINDLNLSGITASGNTCSQPASTGAEGGMTATKWIGRAKNNTVTGDTSEVIVF